VEATPLPVDSFGGRLREPVSKARP
jgi:hypothetical protein